MRSLNIFSPLVSEAAKALSLTDFGFTVTFFAIALTIDALRTIVTSTAMISADIQYFLANLSLIVLNP